MDHHASRHVSRIHHINALIRTNINLLPRRRSAPWRPAACRAQTLALPGYASKQRPRVSQVAAPGRPRIASIAQDFHQSAVVGRQSHGAVVVIGPGSETRVPRHYEQAATAVHKSSGITAPGTLPPPKAEVFHANAHAMSVRRLFAGMQRRSAPLPAPPAPAACRKHDKPSLLLSHAVAPNATGLRRSFFNSTANKFATWNSMRRSGRHAAGSSAVCVPSDAHTSVCPQPLGTRRAVHTQRHCNNTNGGGLRGCVGGHDGRDCHDCHGLARGVTGLAARLIAAAG